MNNLWFVAISKIEGWNTNPRSKPTREEADKVMKEIGGKVDGDEIDGYLVVLPPTLDTIVDRNSGSFTIDLTVDGEDYELTLTQ